MKKRIDKKIPLRKSRNNTVGNSRKKLSKKQCGNNANRDLKEKNGKRKGLVRIDVEDVLESFNIKNARKDVNLDFEHLHKNNKVSAMMKHSRTLKDLQTVDKTNRGIMKKKNGEGFQKFEYDISNMKYIPKGHMTFEDAMSWFRRFEKQVLNAEKLPEKEKVRRDVSVLIRQKSVTNLSLFYPSELCGENYKYAFFTDIGRRPMQEDRHDFEIKRENEYSFFGVYDGHGGYGVSEFLRTFLSKEVYRRCIEGVYFSCEELVPEWDDNYESFECPYEARLLRDAFLEVNKKLKEFIEIKKKKANSLTFDERLNVRRKAMEERRNLQNAANSRVRSRFIGPSKLVLPVVKKSIDISELNLSGGSCAATVLVHEDICTCANAGDSRIVLYHRDGKTCERLSIDHHKSNKDEWERIRKNPGLEKYRYGGRVVGMLNITRSFGDFFPSKDEFDNKYFPIICIPYVSQFRISVEKHKFLVIASDGLWEVMKDDSEVFEIIGDCENPADAVHKLYRKFASKIQDNVTIQILLFETKEESEKRKIFEKENLIKKEEKTYLEKAEQKLKEIENSREKKRQKQQEEEIERKKRNFERTKRSLKKRKKEILSKKKRISSSSEEELKVNVSTENLLKSPIRMAKISFGDFGRSGRFSIQMRNEKQKQKQLYISPKKKKKRKSESSSLFYPLAIRKRKKKTESLNKSGPLFSFSSAKNSSIGVFRKKKKKPKSSSLDEGILIRGKSLIGNMKKTVKKKKKKKPTVIITSFSRKNPVNKKKKKKMKKKIIGNGKTT